MKKYLFMAALVFIAGKSMATRDQDLPSATTTNQSFAYRKEIFELYMTSDIDLDSPSLTQLYKDAQARKMRLDALFEHVRGNKFNKEKNKDIFTSTNYSKKRKEDIGSNILHEDLYMIGIVQADYLPERDLTDYFLQALAGFSQTPPTQEQIQELYKQTVYASRMNLESLKNAIFLHLKREYPNKYSHIIHQSKTVQQELMIPCKFNNKEDDFYALFRCNHPESINNVSSLDTVSVTKIARTLTHPPVALTNPGIIYELNSLLFYLNIERALLSASPDLVFTAEDYAFKKDLESQSNTFALSRISAHHRRGIVHEIMSSQNPDQKNILFCLRTKERLLETLLKEKAQEPIEFFLHKLFPVALEKETITSKRPKEKAQKGKGKKSAQKTPKGQNRARNVTSSHSVTVESSQKTFLFDFLTQEDGHEEDQGPATFEELQEIDILIEQEGGEKRTYASMVTSNTPTITTIILPIAPYKPRLHVDDHAYKRCISTSPNGSYFFMDQPFIMKGTFFDVDTLRQIKELTHHDPERPHFQNLASYHLRFHFQHADGKLDMMDFRANQDYLSGGRRLGTEYREKFHVKMAFHDYLTLFQAKTYLQKGKDENRTFLLNTLSSELNECAVQGPWHHNCADSEALMVIDLQKEMPEILKAIAPSTGEKITLLGAVLGASSYHDVCWRCRNLFQGWQWGLDDTITHWKDAYHLPITLSPDFSTIVFGFGEVAPQSHDFFPPRASQVPTVLGLSGHEARRHKLKIVSLKKETL